jgi:transposase InsO family protein
LRKNLTVKAKRDIIAGLKSKYKIVDLCDLLGLKHCSYYYKENPKVIPQEQRKAVIASFYGSNRAYGQEKISHELRQNGMPISQKTVSKIMRQEGLVSKYVQRRKPAVEKTNRDAVDNKLNRQFGGYKTGEVIVSDLTYVDLHGKWCYVCLIVELSHREIIGYSAGRNHDAELVKSALYSVKCDLRNIGKFHTDRGGEFKNEDIEKVLNDFGIERSLSRPGKPVDNAVAESMYDILKTEFIFDEIFVDLQNLKERLDDWVFWYNNKRLHGSLGMITPVQSRQTREVGATKTNTDFKKIARNQKKKNTIITAAIDINNKK